MYQDLPLSEIFIDHEFNCRGHISAADVAELAASIEHEGRLLTPIIVQPYANLEQPQFKYRVVNGHRRTMAMNQICSRKPNWPKTITAEVCANLTPITALTWNIRENLDREDLNILQEARAIQKYLAHGYDTASIAKELGQTKRWVGARLALLSLPEPIQRRAEAKWLTQYQIEELADMATDTQRFERVKEIVNHKMRGERKPVDPKKSAKRKGMVAFRKGTPPSMEVLHRVQEHLQDSSHNFEHPAAVAFAFAGGHISEDALWKHVEQWAADEGWDFVQPEVADAAV